MKGCKTSEDTDEGEEAELRSKQLSRLGESAQHSDGKAAQKIDRQRSIGERGEAIAGAQARWWNRCIDNK